MTDSWRHAVTIEIDTSALQGVTDSRLAALWHVAQANPAPQFEDGRAGELVAKIGYEIIRRWLTAAEPELYHHQDRHYYWHQLTRLGNWPDGPDGPFVPFGPDHPRPDHLAGAGSAPRVNGAKR